MHLSVSSPRGVGNLREFDCGVDRVGILIGHAFDLSILYSRREVNHLFLLILTILFCPGVGILIIVFRKCQNPHPMPAPPLPSPPPLGLDTDRCINSKRGTRCKKAQGTDAEVEHGCGGLEQRILQKLIIACEQALGSFWGKNSDGRGKGGREASSNFPLPSSPLD